MERRRILAALVVVIVAMLLMGCALLDEFASGIAKEDPESAEPEASAPAAPGQQGEDAEADIAGRWAGSLTFSDFEILVGDEQTELAFANEIAGTMDKPYSIIIDMQPAQETATINFDGSLVIPGAMSRTGDSVTFEFRQAGTGSLEAGVATLPVTFTLTGQIADGPEPTMSGDVRYDVSTMDGAPGWVQMGTWSLERY
ncbi:MAG: hypothetical protein Q7W51_04995 [Coriobacteriia bacterium]|nr:hypothetical protein [Coriobacteriia bacterium]